MVAAPKQQRSQRTLEKIVLATRALLLERAIGQISMQDIAGSAGISVGNLYNRFADKDALINHVVSEIQQQIDASVSGKLADQPEEMVLRDRLAFLAQTLASDIRDLRPVLATIASRPGASTETLDERNKIKTDELIEEFTDWLMKREAEVNGPDKRQRCRFAAGTIAFGVQFNVMFGTAERLFGESYFQQLSEMAYASLVISES